MLSKVSLPILFLLRGATVSVDSLSLICVSLICVSLLGTWCSPSSILRAACGAYGLGFPFFFSIRGSRGGSLFFFFFFFFFIIFIIFIIFISSCCSFVARLLLVCCSFVAMLVSILIFVIVYHRYDGVFGCCYACYFAC